jgi:catalase
VQLVAEADEHSFDFDLLDATKIIPEEQVPVRPVGRMILNRNPDNFFAETEQVAFHTANIVPGIDFTNDPLLQMRNFSYLDTQLIRLGGPNFAQIPVNRPIAEVSTNQRDGYHQSRVHQGRTAYFKNSLSGGCPAIADERVFRHYQERVDGHKIRKRATSFQDYYSQATLFWNSMSDWEREHIVAAFRFELGKVDHMHIRQAVVEHLTRVDHRLAVQVAEGVGVKPPTEEAHPNHGRSSPALSQANNATGSIRSRKVAVLVADGVEAGPVTALAQELRRRGAVPELLAATNGAVRTSTGGELTVDRAMNTMASVLYDAVVVPGGDAAATTLSGDGYAMHFIAEAIKHAKPVAAVGAGARLVGLATANVMTLTTADGATANEHGVLGAPSATTELPEGFIDSFCDSLAAHRVWTRPTAAIPA